MAKKDGKKKGGKGLIIGIVIFLMLAAGGVVGTAFVGILKIPGITPKKLLAKNSKLYGETKDQSMLLGAKDLTVKPIVAKSQPKPQRVAKPTTRLDSKIGAQRVADVWSQMETSKLVLVAKSWKDSDLARVLAEMDESKAAELLALLDPKQASKVSQEIGRQQSIVKI